MHPTAGLERPWGQRLRTWREEIKGWSREEFVDQVVAAAFRTNEARGQTLGPRLVARWESGAVQRPQGVYRRILAHMGAPLPATQSATLLPSKRPGSTALDVDDGDVDRRHFLRASGIAAITTAAAASEPWQRLASALAGTNRPDVHTVAAAEQQTLALFDSEERIPAAQLVTDVNGHLDQISTLLAGADDEALRARLVSQAGASAALAGWLAFDLGSSEHATRYYDLAEQAARQVNDVQLVACLYAYRSYLADTHGDHLASAQFIQAGLDALPQRGEPEMKAWLGARLAETAVSLGQRDDALRYFDRAYTTNEFARTVERPIWTRFFTPTRLDGMAIAGYARLNHADMETAADSLRQGITTCETKVEQIALADLAYAYLERGDVEQGATYGQRALDVISRSNTRVGYERLTTISQALAPYRDSRVANGFASQLDDALTDVSQ